MRTNHSLTVAARINRVTLLLLAAMLLAAGVRVYRANLLPCISRDGVFFVQFAQELADDPVFYMSAEKKQPGYAWALLGTHRLVGERLGSTRAMQWERSGQLLAILGGVAVVPLLFLLARALFDTRIGLAAAGLAAVWPQCVDLSADVLSDAPHLAIYLAALWFGLRGLRRRTWAPLVLCGFAGGLGYLVRQESLAIPLAVGVCLLLDRRGGPWRPVLARCAVLAAAFALTVAPYAVATGRVMHNKTLMDLLIGPGDQAEQAAAPVSAATPTCVSTVMLAPASAAQNAAAPSVQRAAAVTGWSAPWEMATAWCRSGMYVVSTWAIVAWLWPAVPSADARGRRLLALAALLQLAAAQLRGTWFGVISDRYLMIPAALSIPWAAAALVTAGSLIGKRVRSRGDSAPWSLRTAAAITAFALAAAGPMLYRCVRSFPENADCFRRAGAFLAERSAGDAPIVGIPRLHRLAFYAEQGHVWPGLRGSPTEGNALTGTWFADYSDLRDLTEADRDLLQRLRRRVAGLRPVGTWRTAEGEQLAVYRLPGTGGARLR